MDSLRGDGRHTAWLQVEYYDKIMALWPQPYLLPEEDVLDEADVDDDADPTVPGDLWFHARGGKSRPWAQKVHRILATG